ncbi:MAG: hypothetical protein CL554_20215 [Algoriphagus sp.]|uniref:glycosyltransferase family 4 protein n=1 Tax=Algoriphagus sp. TaxID=1872435 RepID=UPI000C497C03|nr:glycosyltransferase family 4 protein [Algoriphagus sp.]MAL15735.1 hypothetical protein [Algoriphagus sp.]|tara:strand:- start:300 stop:1550 length:1251 start_codon:yes stop_codon:yes gene_type:complete
MSKKIKVFVISDHPFSPSGVGIQTRYMIEGLLETGDYQFICFGGAVKHSDYTPVKTDKWGDDLIVYPVDGYGTQDSVRSILMNDKPDMLWFMTDPRFYAWLWEIEDEIRSLIPMVYYHVWDNYPYPTYNKIWYDSCDHIACISKLTHDIVSTVAPDVECSYHPHAVDNKIFKPVERSESNELRQKTGLDPDKFVIFWNSRNARRKHSGTLIFWFNKFLDKVGRDKAQLIMHTDPDDVNGPNLMAIASHLDLLNGQVQFSRNKLEFDQLASLYNMSDVTVNISDAEGFGLSALESLSCGTPIVVTMTGGLQDQVKDGDDWYGIGLEPVSKSIIGSQQIPFIYEDRLNEDDFINALEKIYNMSKEERDEWGKKAREHVMKNFSFDKYRETWDIKLKEIYKKHGPWGSKKEKQWELLEV